MSNLKITDIDLNFTAHPITGDISMKTGDAAIKQSLKNLLLTSILERPFNTQLNINLREYLFLNFNIIYEDELKEQISSLLEEKEPRIQINSIGIIYEETKNSLTVSLDYTIKSDNKSIQSLDIIVERTR